ncbi:4'-phosphopantetheinyl transferase superfamily protein [Streptomyces sp. HNM0574]|uniref:4'-phosphopantetheinyl transferase superfamily protein n=1 Tax=Streptomyces sp. HNM0574 TaxID=2714954 RepID=UPI003217CAFD
MFGGRVGVDVVPFSRVRRLLAPEARPALLRMLSGAEAGRYCAERPDVPGIAGRLAAKEAVFKLFQATEVPLPWRSIEVLNGAGGWPEVRLGGRAAALAERAGVGHVEVSIAHDDPCAVAVALGAGPARTPRKQLTIQERKFRQGGSMSSGGIDDVRKWILGRNPDRDSLSADENLIESRLVDSLSFVELVYAIEGAGGIEIDLDAIDLQDFRTLAAIEKAFFTAA